MTLLPGHFAGIIVLIRPSVPTMGGKLSAGGEDMAKAARRALVDLSGIDLTALRLAEGSALEQALARVQREQDQGGWEYASFMNSPAVEIPEEPERDSRAREGE